MKIEACSSCADPCCSRTTYCLTNEDIVRIIKIDHLNFHDYAFEKTDGTYQLKKPCFFYHSYHRICTIYKHRPLGCKIYPVVLDDVATVDTFCPGHAEVKDPVRKTIILQHYLKSIEREAQERLE